MYGFIPSFPHEGPPRRQKKKGSQVDHGRAPAALFSYAAFVFGSNFTELQLHHGPVEG